MANMADVNYNEIKNKFNDYLLNTLKLQKDKDLSTKDLIQKYNAEFKAFLVDYKDANIDTFSKSAQDVNKQPNTALDEMFKDYMNDVGAQNQAFKLADKDNNGQISDDERNNFFLAINSIDNDTKTISLDDFTNAIKGIESNDSTILKLFGNQTAQQTVRQAVAQQAAQQAQQAGGAAQTSETQKQANKAEAPKTGTSGELKADVVQKTKEAERAQTAVYAAKSDYDAKNQSMQSIAATVDKQARLVEELETKKEQQEKVVKEKQEALAKAQASGVGIERAQAELRSAQVVFNGIESNLYNQTSILQSTSTSYARAQKDTILAGMSFEGAIEMQKACAISLETANAKLEQYYTEVQNQINAKNQAEAALSGYNPSSSEQSYDELQEAYETASAKVEISTAYLRGAKSVYDAAYVQESAKEEKGSASNTPSEKNSTAQTPTKKSSSAVSGLVQGLKNMLTGALNTIKDLFGGKKAPAQNNEPSSNR